jgi:hypothetical protein
MDSALIAAERNNLILAFEPRVKMSSTRRLVRASFSMSFAILAYGRSSTPRISFLPDAIRKKSSMKLLLY